MTYLQGVSMSLVVTFFTGLAGPTYNPAPGGASGQDLSDELVKTIRSLPKDLSTEEQKERFAKRLGVILDARIKANINGYERDTDFKRRSDDIRSEVATFLKRQVPEPREEDVRSLASAMTEAYQKNENKFNTFYERVNAQDTGLSKEEVRDTIVRFSAILYLNDKELWEKARRFTFIFPFC
jgi:hypothetical protein